ncbi:MAG: hypothetical protein JSR77_08605 [Planctomycetes bacterium]|nr:hypothetical protein [Planctomycetota bacterium]
MAASGQGCFDPGPTFPYGIEHSPCDGVAVSWYYGGTLEPTIVFEVYRRRTDTGQQFAFIGTARYPNQSFYIDTTVDTGVPYEYHVRACRGTCCHQFTGDPVRITPNLVPGVVVYSDLPMDYCSGVQFHFWRDSSCEPPIQIYRAPAEGPGIGELMATSYGPYWIDRTAALRTPYRYSFRTNGPRGPGAFTTVNVFSDPHGPRTEPLRNPWYVDDVGGSISVYAADADEMTYQWRREGVDLADDGHYSGTRTATLAIDSPTASDESLYDVVVTSPCGASVATGTQLVFNLACRLGCYCDYNMDGGLDGADVEAFFLDWEAGERCADYNEDGGIDGADVEAYITLWERCDC